MATELTQERLRELLIYHPEHGQFFWLKMPSARCRRDAPAGYLSKESGYIYIRVDKKLYRAHRLAWLYTNGEWPTDHIDHINGDRADNRWSNLRNTSQSGNIANSRLSAANTSGFKGVIRHRHKWLAQIKKDYVRHHLGIFDTAEEAHAAYCRAADELHGEFSRYS